MKFLVINKSRGASHNIAPTGESATKFAHKIAEALKSGTIEAAYALISGGHVVVLSADSTEELTLKIRENPLFRSSDTEIHPIADAVDFLHSAARDEAKFAAE